MTTRYKLKCSPGGHTMAFIERINGKWYLRQICHKHKTCKGGFDLLVSDMQYQQWLLEGLLQEVIE